MSNKKEDVFGQDIAITKELIELLSKLGNKPAYTNSFDSPVYTVNHASIKRADGFGGEYELQLNGLYFKITRDTLETLESIVRMPDDVGISIG